jgi:thiol-disulfide isomerase/thioredoxin
MKFFLTFIFATCLIFNSLAQNFVIKGKIKNPLENRVSIAIHNLFDNDLKAKVSLDINGEFYYSTKLNDIAFLQFEHSNTNPDSACRLRNIIIEPNDEIEMNFDAKNFWESVVFKGKSSEKFNYYKEDFLEMTQKLKWEERFFGNLSDSTKTIDEQFEILNKAETRKFEILEKYKNSVSDIFYKIQQAECKAEVSNNKFFMLYDTKKGTLKPFKGLKIEHQEVFFSNLPSQSDTTAKSIRYINYLMNLVGAMGNDIFESSKNTNATFSINSMASMQFLFNSHISERMNAENTMASLSINGINAESLKQYSEFKSLYPQSKYQNKIENIYQTKLQNKGSTAFAIKTLENKELKIEDFKGKIVLLDFWASWCKPCLAEMRHAKKLKEHFKNRNDLVFLYLSQDTDEQAWKDAIEKYKITGINGIISQEHSEEISRKYMDVGLPTYKIILKDGSIHKKTVPYPSQNEGKDLISLLEEALKKQ